MESTRRQAEPIPFAEWPAPGPAGKTVGVERLVLGVAGPFFLRFDRLVQMFPSRCVDSPVRRLGTCKARPGFQVFLTDFMT